MHAIINPDVVSWCLLVMGLECGWGLEEDSNFQLVRGLKIEF